jgi:hypothetical protein
MSTLKTTNLQHASAASPTIVLAADGSATAQLSSINGGPLAGARNRIINGDMRIDQRNAGASVAVTNASTYTVDRWAIASPSSFGGQLTAQRSTVAPAGFTNSLSLTVTTADSSIGASEYYAAIHRIEGNNIADLAWGTANAKHVTLSFWVRASIAGEYSGSLRNAASDRSCVFNYSISSANTWEFKTVGISGDTTGTWLTDNGVGIDIFWSVGTGGNFQSSIVSSFRSGTYLSSSGQVPLISTNGATFYITGVQLEAGTVATPFERRSYGQELALCQRYFRLLKSGLIGFWASATEARLNCTWLGMRATPSFSQSGTLTITDNTSNLTQSSAAIADNGSNADGGQLSLTNLSGANANRVAAVLNSSAGSILVSSEL